MSKVTGPMLAVIASLLSVNSITQAQPDDGAGGSIDAACGSSDRARQLARLIINDAGQHRSQLRCNATLTAVAEQKVRDMAEHGQVSHIGPGGANARLRAAGYPLPAHYPSLGANQVEAVAGGYGDPHELWRQFKASRAHRLHLLGEHPFYRRQNEIGVAYSRRPESPHEFYWAVYVAEQDEPSRFASHPAAGGVPDKSTYGD